jgi:hypothetical protein
LGTIIRQKNISPEREQEKPLNAENAEFDKRVQRKPCEVKSVSHEKGE